MSVDPATAKHAFTHAGTSYYFCCASCQSKFAADPDGWLARGPGVMSRSQPLRLHTTPRPSGPGPEHTEITAEHSAAAVHPPAHAEGASRSTDRPTPSAEYTCPMHP